MYSNVIDAVNEDETGGWINEYENRLEKVVLDTRGIGWGFHDELAELHAHLLWD